MRTGQGLWKPRIHSLGGRRQGVLSEIQKHKMRMAREKRHQKVSKGNGRNFKTILCKFNKMKEENKIEFPGNEQGEIDADSSNQ